MPQAISHSTLAAIGCTGEIGAVFVSEFLRMGIAVKLLARDPERTTKQYPDAEVIKGSMLDVDDVARTVGGADAVFLMTPIGPRNDNTIEIEATRAAVAAGQAVNAPHIIFVSVIGIDHHTGVPLLDSKRAIEIMLSKSGIPWTAIRCGTYMEDVIDRTLPALKRGIFIMPVPGDRQFNFTCQHDLARLVSQLLAQGKALNQAIDFIDPHTYRLSEVAQMMSRAARRRIVHSGKFPIFHALSLAYPFLYWRKHRLSTIYSLIRYFDRNGYTGDIQQMADVFPGFKMTTLGEHLQLLLGDGDA